MRLFTYRALHQKGIETRGFIRADSEDEARDLLEKKGLKVRSLNMEEEPDRSHAGIFGEPSIAPEASSEADHLQHSGEHCRHSVEASPASLSIKEPSAESPRTGEKDKQQSHATPARQKSVGASPAPSEEPSPQSRLHRSYPRASHHSEGKKAHPAKKDGKPAGIERILPVPATEIFTFFNQMAFLYKAGVSLTRGLALMSSQTLNRKMRIALEDIHGKLEAGNSLTASIHSHPDIFSKCYVALINSGETSGQLESMLFRAAGLKEKELKLSQRIQQAVTYPFFIFVVVMVFIFLLGRVLVLNIAPVIASGNTQLPAATEMLISFYRLISSPYLPLSVILIALIGFHPLMKLMKSHSFVRFRDRFLCALPVLGPLVHKVALSRFCHTLSAMLDSGISINSGLLLAGESSANTQCMEECREIESSISEGRSLYDSIGAGKFFPRIVSDMVKVGEESGTIPYMLSQAATLMESEVDHSLTVFYQTLEPFLIAFLGLFVALIAFAVLMPLNSIFSTLSQ
jgi:type II secretory pathway component PulF